MDLRIRFPPLLLLSRTFPRNQPRCPELPRESRRTHTRCFSFTSLSSPTAPGTAARPVLPRYLISRWETTEKRSFTPLLPLSLSPSRSAGAFLRLEPPYPSGRARSCRGSAQVRWRLTKLRACGSLKQITLRKLLVSNS